MELKRIRWLLPLLMVALVAACASTPTNKPEDAIAKAQLAVKQAQQDKADQYAAKMLYNANKKLDSAKHLVRQEDASQDDYDKARRRAEEATADAQLADARSEAKQAQAQTEQVHKGMHVLRQEMNRKEAQ